MRIILYYGMFNIYKLLKIIYYTNYNICVDVYTVHNMYSNYYYLVGFVKVLKIGITLMRSSQWKDPKYPNALTTWISHPCQLLVLKSVTLNRSFRPIKHWEWLKFRFSCKFTGIVYCGSWKVHLHGLLKENYILYVVP